MTYKIKRKTEKQKLNQSMKKIDRLFELLGKKKRLTKFEEDVLLMINNIYKGRISPTETNKFASYLDI